MKSKIKMKRENKIKSTVNDLDTRMVWKDLGSRRIGKSLEGVRVRNDVKEQRFLMVYT